ncbi:alanine:cation symporter family protein [Nannocystaceae bacterium ST9]
MMDVSPLAQAILVYAVLAVGLLATLLTGFAQVRALRAGAGDRSALAGRRGMLAASAGMGSVAGSLLALEVGGPGAIGWMWIATLLGMGLVYAEVQLAVKHRRRGASGRLEAATTHVLEQVGGKPLAIVLAVVLVATLVLLAPMLGSLATRMQVIAGLGGVVMVALAVVAIRGLWQTDSGRPHALLFGLLIMPFAIAAGSLLQTQQASVLLGSLGGDRWLAAGVLVAATAAGLLVPKLRGFVIALAPVAVGLYATAIVWIVLRAPGEVGPALNQMALGIAGSGDALVGGALGGGVLMAMQTGFLRATLATEAGLGSAGFMHELDHARSPERAAASAMLAPVIAGVLVPTLTALAAMTATPWVGQRIDEPAERRPSADEREASSHEQLELAAALDKDGVEQLLADDRKRVVALWAPLERPQSRGTAASLQTGQTVVLPEDAVVAEDAAADLPGLRRDHVYPMIMRGSPRGTKVPTVPGENQILMTKSDEALVVREVVYHDRDTERSQYSAYDLRIPVDNEPVVRNGIEGLKFTPSNPEHDFDVLANLYDGPYMVFGDYHFQGHVVRMFQSSWGLHDALVEAVPKEKHQLSLRTTVPTSSWRGPYFDEAEPRPPFAMVAKPEFTAPVGARVSMAYRSPERGLDVGFMLPNGELQTPPWRFLERTTHAVLRHVDDPSKDLRVPVEVRFVDGVLRFRSGDLSIVDFGTWQRWAEYTGPFLDAPAYEFEVEVHTGARFPASAAYLQRLGQQRKSLVGPFSERRTLVAVHPDGEPRGPAGELYDPHPAEVAPFMDGPWVTGEGVERLGLATRLSNIRGADLLLAVGVLLLALTTMITWAGDGARAADQVFGRGAGLGFALVFLLAGLGGATLELLPILRVVDHLMIGLIVLNGAGLIVLLVRARRAGT